MTPEISEFSYGFAFTHELITQANSTLVAAPIFPTQNQEGASGGGYDVHLEFPGFPLFIQFKRADCMKRRSAKEHKQGLNLDQPFYRLRITERSRSDQHDLLLHLDVGANEVFYVAPLFHSVQELTHSYLSQTVTEKSFCIRPRDIGQLDNQAHHVAFDAHRFYVCSDEPRALKATRARDLPEHLSSLLKRDSRPFRAGPLDEALEAIESAIRDSGAHSRPEAMPPKAPVPESEERRKLQKLADLSLGYFGAQLFIVQPKEDAVSV